MACETSGIPIILDVEIGDSFETVEEIIGVSLETKPLRGPGIERPYTEVFAIVLYNGYSVQMVFDDMTQTLTRIKIGRAHV